MHRRAKLDTRSEGYQSRRLVCIPVLLLSFCWASVCVDTQAARRRRRRRRQGVEHPAAKHKSSPPSSKDPQTRNKRTHRKANIYYVRSRRVSSECSKLLMERLESPYLLNMNKMNKRYRQWFQSKIPDYLTLFRGL